MKWHKVLFLMLSMVSSQAFASDYKVEVGALNVPVGANIISPSGVAVNSEKEVIVTSRGAYKVMVFNHEGEFLRGFGQDVLVAPHGLRIDQDDNIWVTDVEQHIVLKLSPEGRVLMVLGQQNNKGEFDKERNMALFYKPADIAFGLDDDLYVADGYGNTRIVQFSKEGDFIREWGVAGKAAKQFNNPHNIVVADNGKVFVADRHNKRIQIFTSEGKLIDIWDHLGKPWGLDADDSHLYLTDGNAEKVLVLDFKGKILESFGGVGEVPGKFRAAHGIAVDDAQNIWVTEILNWRVQKFAK
jgi:sugar lactone lactonase YvrE